MPTKTRSLFTALALASAACGGGDDSGVVASGVSTTVATTSSAATTVVAAATTPGTTTTTSTYTSTAFVLPFEVTVPEWLTVEASVDEPNFVTWDAPDIDRAVRFLVPVEIYAPGATNATAPPDDYLAYLMDQEADGAKFTDMADTTVDGRPATVLTATVATSLDGSLGCPETGMAPADCFGLQPDLKLRIAVIDADDKTLLVWVRDLRGASAEYESFEAMLASIRIDEARTPSPTPRHRETAPGGTYATTAFRPTITYTVPDGWINEEDLPGNFLLQLDDDPRYLGIYRNVAAPFECEERRDPDVDQSVDAITEWLTSHPGLVTTAPEPVLIGGLNGVFVDISLDPSWTITCPYSQGAPVVPFIIGGGPSNVHHVILPGFQERLYLLELDDGNVAIEVGPEGASLPDYLAVVTPILESLTFTR